MATIPVHTIEVIERFGPHLARSKGARLDSGVAPDKTVKTHCCFCGQQCGVERVADGRRVSSRHVYRGNLPAGQGDRFGVSVFIPRYFFYVAVFAWLVTFAGFVHSLLRALLDLRLQQAAPR